MTKEKDWCAWQRKAEIEPDLFKREGIYREGLKDFPESAELTYNFANFRQNSSIAKHWISTRMTQIASATSRSS